jgi:hypothetical protein
MRSLTWLVAGVILIIIVVWFIVLPILDNPNVTALAARLV